MTDSPNLDTHIRIFEQTARTYLGKLYLGPGGSDRFAKEWKQSVSEGSGLPSIESPSILDLKISHLVRFLIETNAMKEGKAIDVEHLKLMLRLVLECLTTRENPDSEYTKILWRECFEQLTKSFETSSQVPIELDRSKKHLLSDLYETCFDCIQVIVKRQVGRVHGGQAEEWMALQIHEKSKKSDFSWDIGAYRALLKTSSLQELDPLNFQNQMNLLRFDCLYHLRNKLAHGAVPFGAPKLACLIGLEWLDHHGYSELLEQFYDRFQDFHPEFSLEGSMPAKSNHNPIYAVCLTLLLAFIVYRVTQNDAPVVAETVVNRPVVPAYAPPPSQSEGPYEMAPPQQAVPALETNDPSPAPSEVVVVVQQASPTAPGESPRKPSQNQPPVGFEDVQRTWSYTSSSVKFDNKATIHWAESCTWRAKISERNLVETASSAQSIFSKFKGDGVDCSWCSTCWSAEPLTSQ